MPELLTKKWLCIHFGLYSSRTNRCYYDLLYQRILTESVLMEAGISAEEVKKVKTFTRPVSIRLKQLLAI